MSPGVIGKHFAFATLVLGLVAADDSGRAADDRPSFDCRKARVWAEKAICADPALADLDRRMAQVYREIGSGLAEGERAALSEGQREWVVQRNDCEQAANPLDCLRLGYEGRLGALADLERGPISAPRLPPTVKSRFLCEDGRELDVTFHTGEPARVVIVAGRRTIELAQTVSASGARYSDGVTTFWNKGDQALFEWANGSTRCRANRLP